MSAQTYSRIGAALQGHQDLRRSLDPAFKLLELGSDPAASSAALSSVDDTQIPDGSVRFVLSTRASYELDKTSVLAPITDVVVATHSGTGRWCRTSKLTATFLKRTSQSKTSNVLSVDSELVLPVLAGQKLHLILEIIAATGAGHFQMGIAAPAGSTGIVSAVDVISGANFYLPLSGVPDATAFNTSVLGTTFVSVHYLVTTYVVVGANGTIGLLWAQNSLDASATTVIAGSYMSATLLLS